MSVILPVTGFRPSASVAVGVHTRGWDGTERRGVVGRGRVPWLQGRTHFPCVRGTGRVEELSVHTERPSCRCSPKTSDLPGVVYTLSLIILEGRGSTVPGPTGEEADGPGRVARGPCTSRVDGGPSGFGLESYPSRRSGVPERSPRSWVHRQSPVEEPPRGARPPSVTTPTASRWSLVSGRPSTVPR